MSYLFCKNQTFESSRQKEGALVHNTDMDQTAWNMQSDFESIFLTTNKLLVKLMVQLNDKFFNRPNSKDLQMTNEMLQKL